MRRTHPFGYWYHHRLPSRLRRVTYPPFNQPSRPTGRGWFVVLGAAVLGVLVFCGIVVAAAGNKDTDDDRDPSRTGALVAPPTSAPATPVSGTATTGAATTPPQTTPPAAPSTVQPTPTRNIPATNIPTTKAPATKAPTKAPTRPAGNCNPNYSPCVPNDPVDVDCKGGGGNGPSYVDGPVRVIGNDVYGLDKDGDGIGCE